MTTKVMSERGTRIAYDTKDSLHSLGMEFLGRKTGGTAGRDDRRSIISGRHVTGHPIEYDYHDGTGFVGTDINIGTKFGSCRMGIDNQAVMPSTNCHTAIAVIAERAADLIKEDQRR